MHIFKKYQYYLTSNQICCGAIPLVNTASSQLILTKVKPARISLPPPIINIFFLLYFLSFEVNKKKKKQIIKRIKKNYHMFQ